jgi:hypothetical protein
MLWLLEQQHNPSPVAEQASEAAPRVPSSWIDVMQGIELDAQGRA